MGNKKDVSTLSDHKLYKKRGVVATPFNDRLGNVLQLNSWARERMPEYLWLGLVLLSLGRRNGLDKAGQILYEITQKLNSLSYPQLSSIFGLPEDQQIIVYEIIRNNIPKEILTPLTIIYKNKDHHLFNKYFFITKFTVEDKISILSKAIKIFFPNQSHESTDLRFLIVSYVIFGKRLHFPIEMKNTVLAFQEYPNTNHDDEKMKQYRPTVRSMEGLIGEKNQVFLDKFWRDIGMMTKCNPIVIKYSKRSKNYKKYISEYKKILQYILHENKEKSLNDQKFEVIIGSINYALKILNEINEKSLGKNILGRHGIRTLIEIFIMLKYLLKKESENQNIWEEYKLYGISKYKLTLLKVREKEENIDSHFVPPVVDALVNEMKWEEFIDIDLKYFDKLGIREKSIEVGEKELYDLFYDYDSNFSHGLWGAIRESAMLYCDNPDHKYHSIPDLDFNQILPDVKADCMIVIKKLFILLTDIYNIPKELSSILDK